jgi:sugar-specific transcriptional regulator TrmB
VVAIENHIDEERIRRLRKTGLTEYEARAYLALVGLHEATAREILTSGKIPQGRVYDVLRTLASKGYVEIQGGSPVYFRAVDPTDVIRNLGQEYTKNLQELMDTLKDLHVEAPPTYPVWVIQNKTSIINRIRALVKSADREIIVYTSSPEFFRPFVPELRRAGKRTKLYIIVDDPGSFPFRGLVFRKADEEFSSVIGKFNIDGVLYRGVISLIIDGREEFDVMTINGKLMGLVTKLPVFHYIIRRWLWHLGLVDTETP